MDSGNTCPPRECRPKLGADVDHDGNDHDKA